MNNYIFNIETTKIELHFEKAQYDTFDDAQKRAIKSAFLWSNRGKCWVSRAKEPNLWLAKDVAKKLGFTDEKRVGKRLTYAEQLERQAERSEERADRYDSYAANAAGRATQLQKPVSDMHGDIAFFTQPNINSSAGRAFTRQREKMFERYKRGFEEYRKSKYFVDRAATARETASQVKFNDLGYLDRRIKECKAEIRAREKNIIGYEKTLNAIESGEEIKNYDGSIITADIMERVMHRELELVEKAMDKQGYLENCLDKLGGIRFSKENVKVGYIVQMRRMGRAEIISAGPVNVTYKSKTGMFLKAPYADITEVIEAVEKKRVQHRKAALVR